MKTLGQIAYEEWASIVHPDIEMPWEQVGMQVGWENIAQAVVLEESARFEEMVLNPPPLRPADKAVLDEIGPTPFRDLRNLRRAMDARALAEYICDDFHVMSRWGIGEERPVTIQEVEESITKYLAEKTKPLASIPNPRQHGSVRTRSTRPSSKFPLKGK